MKPVLAPDLKIAEIVQHYPECAAVFQAQGLAPLVSEEGLRVLAPFLTLGTALRGRNIDEYTFLALLEAACEPAAPVEAQGLDDYDRQGELTLLALMPCGLKVPFGRALGEFLERLKAEENVEIRYAVEGNVNQELSYYRYIDRLKHIDELPDIIVSADFNAFYGKDFYHRFVEKGELTGYGEFDPEVAYASAGILDPEGEYSVIGINPLVIVANLDELGERPLPTCWADIIDPMWQASVTLRGNDQFFCHAVLLPIWREHGAAGLEALAENVLRGQHPSQMVKKIDSGASGALYVMPEFFAHRIKHKERIAIIWPEDGALASPVTMQVKKTKVEQLKPVLDFLSGPQLAQALSGARFPVPHRQVESEVQGRPLKWLGWDLLRGRDLLEINAEIDEIFLAPALESLRRAAGQ
jgi:ABC-type Fe3+ transport system substrate-binding protein